MMSVLTPRLHGYLDYATVVFFLVAPALFGLIGAAATLAYTLGFVHLVLTGLTAFPLGLVRAVPFRIHGMIELTVAAALVVLPWVLGSVFAGARVFYAVVGAAIFVVWLLTDYRGARVRG